MLRHAFRSFSTAASANAKKYFLLNYNFVDDMINKRAPVRSPCIDIGV
jgi:hypothetical protein